MTTRSSPQLTFVCFDMDQKWNVESCLQMATLMFSYYFPKLLEQKCLVVCSELFKMLMQWSLRASFYPLFIALLHGNRGRRGGGLGLVHSIKDFNPHFFPELVNNLSPFKHILLKTHISKELRTKTTIMHRIIFSQPNEAIMAQMQTLRSQFAIITICCQEVTSSLTKRYKQLCWITPVEDIVSILQVWQNPKLEKWSQVPYRQQNTSKSQIGSETHKKEQIFCQIQIFDKSPGGMVVKIYV